MDLIGDLNGNIFSPSRHGVIEGVEIIIGDSAEGPQSQSPRNPQKKQGPRGPRVQPTEEEVMITKRFLLELEEKKDLWEPSQSHRLNMVKWKDFTKTSSINNLTVDKAKGLLRKVKSQIKYRILKCEKDGFISRKILRKTGGNQLRDVLYIKYGFEFWRFCDYLTRALIKSRYNVEIAEYLTNVEKRRLREEVGLLPPSNLNEQSRQTSELRHQQPMDFETQNYAQPLPTTSRVNGNQESNSGAASEGFHLSQIKSEVDSTLMDRQSFSPEDTVCGTPSMAFANVMDEPGHFPGGEIGTNAGDQDRTETRGNLELETSPFSLFHKEYYRIPEQGENLTTIKSEPGDGIHAGNPFKFFDDFKVDQLKQIRELGAPEIPGYPQVPERFGISQEEFEDRCKAMEDFRDYTFIILMEAKDDEELKQTTIRIMNLIARMNLLKEMGVSEEECNRRLAETGPRK